MYISLCLVTHFDSNRLMYSIKLHFPRGNHCKSQFPYIGSPIGERRFIVIGLFSINLHFPRRDSWKTDNCKGPPLENAGYIEYRPITIKLRSPWGTLANLIFQGSPLGERSFTVISLFTIKLHFPSRDPWKTADLQGFPFRKMQFY